MLGRDSLGVLKEGVLDELLGHEGAHAYVYAPDGPGGVAYLGEDVEEIGLEVVSRVRVRGQLA